MKNVFLVVLLGLTLTGYSQKKTKVEGSLKFLKGQKAIVTEFTYDDMVVGKVPTEAEYLKTRKDELNEKEKGRGDKFEKAWFDDRKNRFEPQFRELFSKHAQISTTCADCTYTMIFKTTFTEPGWNVGVMRVPAYINAEIWFVETSNRSNVLAKVFFTKVPGRDAWGFDFDTGTRLQESYAKAGKELGELIEKELKKK